ncbi:ion transporter [Streptomyces sp. WM6372]|uniref:potassium channel family protein n=1 Tax=Streptomyces sp. WM6372 TaxID=1415555 RepID=UPI0006AF98D3|nr:potassium channel family protein [Streptomyces sp. WM6372]KOU15175.1 ion transporter [Streptomyces sp. WM6372]
MRAEEEPRDRVWERRTELPLFYASLVFMAGYAVRVLATDTEHIWQDVAAVAILVTWGCFLADFLIRLVLSGEKPRRFVRRHWLDAVVVLLPTLRPLRLVKVHDAIRAKGRRPRRSLYPRVITYAGLTSVLLGFSGSLGIYHSERTDPASPIQTFGDSAWCVVQTLTTVGYGDVAPVTPTGRVIAVGLMVCGLALLGAVTGAFSSWLIQVFREEDEEGGEGTPGNGRFPGSPR